MNVCHTWYWVLGLLRRRTYPYGSRESARVCGARNGVITMMSAGTWAASGAGDQNPTSGSLTRRQAATLGPRAQPDLGPQPTGLAIGQSVRGVCLAMWGDFQESA